MELVELNEFLQSNKKTIKNKFGFIVNHRTWFLLKPTTLRSSSFWPMGGFRTLKIKSKFVQPGATELDNQPFSEVLNFKLSQIGEICSKPNEKSNGKGVLYWITGYQSYIPILKPCIKCINSKTKECYCDPHMVAIIDDFEKTIGAKVNNLNEPLIYDLTRLFVLRVCAKWGEQEKLGLDQLTEQH